MRLLILLIFFANNVRATSLDEAIMSVYKDTSTPEIQSQDLAHKINRSNSIESVQKVLPNVYLYYNYSKPGTPNFIGSSPSDNSTFGRFVTGLVQNNYGIAAEYNMLAIPQLIIKISASGNATRASRSATQSKKDEFYYNLAITYIDLCRSKYTLDLQQKIFETTRSRYHEIQKFFSYGRSTKKDLLSAEAAFLTAGANVEQYKNNLTIAQKKYIDKFSVLHTDLTLPNPSLDIVAKSLDELKQLVQENNQDLQSLRYAAKSYNSESYIAALDLLPTVTVGYREAYTRVDPILSIPNYTQNTFYISARLDLLNMTKYLASSRYNNDKNRKLFEAKIAKKNYVTEIESLWHNTKHQEEMIIILQKVVANSKEVYDITRKEVEYGSKSFTDELQAKQDYTSSELQLLEAKLKKAENIYKIKYLTGQTM